MISGLGFEAVELLLLYCFDSYSVLARYLPLSVSFCACVVLFLLRKPVRSEKCFVLLCAVLSEFRVSGSCLGLEAFWFRACKAYLKRPSTQSSYTSPNIQLHYKFSEPKSLTELMVESFETIDFGF